MVEPALPGTPDHAIDPPPVFFISVAEHSADEHGAALIRALREAAPAARFVGFAGPRMQAAGCEVLADLTRGAAMLTGVIGRLPRGWRSVRQADRFICSHSVDAAVLIDSGVLNLPIARRCARRGVPVFYYVAPQIWASRRYRLRTLRRSAARLAVILPFEEAFYRDHGIPATYVGHPLFDHLAESPPQPADIESARAGGSPRVVLLPGSRASVVREVLPGQLEVAAAIAARFPAAQFALCLAHERLAPAVNDITARHARNISIRTAAAPRAALFQAADLVLTVSGTVTLEVAYYHAPMIVMYNARGARWIYPLARRWLLHTEFLSLPNILAGRAIVPEFMPYYRDTRPIAAAALELLESPAAARRMRDDLQAVMSTMRRPGASRAAAAELLRLVAERRAESRR